MKIIDNLQNVIFSVVKELDSEISINDIKLEHPVDFTYGDYSTNIAMVMAKRLKTNPGELANKIKDELNQSINDLEVIEKIETAGVGFINFYLKTEYLIKEAETINYEIEYKNKLSEYGKGKTMVIDYSAPNIAKPFGIGHLRSTDIGQAIYNIYKILGWNCIGDNHIGDWGTQYGKLVAAIKHAKNGDPRFNSDNVNFDIDKLKIEDLEKLYVKFHKEAETDESLIEEGRDYFSKLEKGDKEAREIWQKCIEVSLREFEKVYRLLDVKIDVIHGESFYEPMLEEVTKEIIEKGITKESEGAVIVEFENMPPAMLRKSNGTTTYFTRDMATIKYRLENWQPDLIIYEVGVDQELHFKQVFKTAELMGWMPKDGLVHVAHGLIRWKTGKFSTRKGDTIHLSDVIDKAIEKAKSIAEKSQITKEMSATEKEEMINAVGIGAIKFNDLSSDPRKDVIFDWDQVMSLEGDSGPYLQYTYARCMSVLDKTQIKEQKNINSIPGVINNEELSLVKEFYKFEEKILEASKRFSPAVVAEYLLNVARKYNEFYGKHRIIDQKEEDFRVFLTRTTASVLKTGLHLLGLKTVEKM
jgi:arginyl-tRNA synthetase